MKKLTSLLFTICIVLSYQAGTIRFKQSIGGNAPENGYCARQTYDNGYIAVGTTSSITNGNTDIYVVRTDSNGIVFWTKNYGSANIEVGRYVEQTKDSSLIIVGYTNNTNGKGYDIYLLRLDRWGNKLWEKTYGGSDWEFAYSVHETSDGGFIIAGGTYSYGAGNEDAYLIKTDMNGHTLWTKTYGGVEDDEARSVRETMDGGFVFSGITKSFNDSNGDAYIVKTNSIGDTLWTKYFGGAKEDQANDIIECKNGDFAFCGLTYSYSTAESDQFVTRISSNGILIWENNIVKDLKHDAFEAIVETKSGKLISTGTTSSYGGGQDDGCVVMLDASGNYIPDGKGGFYYGSSVGAGGHDQLFSIAITSDNGYILCGFTDSTKIGFNATNMFLVKTDSLAQFPPMKFWFSTNELNSNIITSATIFPNPFNTEATVAIVATKDMQPSDIKMEMVDIIGRAFVPDYRIVQSQNTNISFQLTVGILKPGIYFIRYYFKGEIAGASKVVVE